ncbi:3'(2'),5'-bisphosphate nucleotidase CysQ [Taklimakanibacter deserti]|uniref:3'(2'),5'-bisphosphate nucleotidase CysQ n=1 Tax=Taklimakanibacter deserti TaxID=2267839 RepID=UPI000E647C77
MADAELLEAAVREAGALARSLFQQSVKGWTKSDGSPVTEADLAVDKVLKARLHEARPDYGWLSEETPDSEARLAHRHVWIVDPIDGTRAFTHGGDEWCVVAALLTDGRPVLAAIYRPMTDDLYQARRGHGASLNGKLLRLTNGRGLAGARILGNASALKQLQSKAPVEAVASGSTPLAMRLARVAQGELDAALSTAPKHDWDLAAGDLLVHEAGGTVTGLNGKMFTYNRRETRQADYVASSHALHAALLEQLATS